MLGTKNQLLHDEGSRGYFPRIQFISYQHAVIAEPAAAGTIGPQRGIVRHGLGMTIVGAAAALFQRFELFAEVGAS
ncbi:hypothetical protein D3C86_1976010 [compost metagenome]